MLAATAVITACGDVASSPDRLIPSRGPRATTSSTCTVPTVSELQTLANAAFTPGMPNVNSVMGGQLNALLNALGQGNLAGAAAKAHEIVDFVLDKYQNNANPATRNGAAVAAFTSAIYCLAGVDITVTDPNNSNLIFPSDLEQVVYNQVKTAAVKFPTFPVNEPTLVTIEGLQTPPLNTKLDQYRGYIFVRVETASGNDPFIGTPVRTIGAIVAVCAEAPGFLFDRQRLRLGHGTRVNWGDTEYPGFEFAADTKYDPALQGEGISLLCPTPAPAAADYIPGEEDATEAPLLQTRAGGVGGTVKTFSPFAPVDEEAQLTQRAGGVGGTVKTFDLLPFLWGDAVRSFESGACTTYTAAIGNATACRPSVQVMTFQRLLSIARGTTPAAGNVLENVPITWTVTGGGGSIAPSPSGPDECGTPVATLSTLTELPTGRSTVCWKMGTTVGPNTLRAQAGIGGDVPAGATFDDGGIEEFTAEATPPTALAFTTLPPAPATAGVAFPVLVEVRDPNGDRVYGYSGQVTLTLNQHGFAGGGTTATATATAGQAAFSLTINKAASGYTLTATASFNATPLTSALTPAFSVVPAVGARITILTANNQSVATGTAISVTARVDDAFDNPVPNVGVTWTAAGSSGGSAMPGTSTTNGVGTASTSWTVGEGANELRAWVTGSSDPEIEAFLNATGTSTLSVVNSCAIGGSRDPINDPGRPFAFYLTHQGASRTLRSIQLYFSATGKANKPSDYEIALITQRGSFNPLAAGASPDTTRATVRLRGNASEDRSATFTLRTPVPMSNGANVMVYLRVLNNPDNATVLFNSGQCPPGTNCRPPNGCRATEVSSPTPFPLGTFFRNTVGVIARGN
jgi:hypothetical protein